jgi:DNA polymerase-1
MIAVQHWLDEQKVATRLLLQVHDELVLEVPDSELSMIREALPGLMGGVARPDPRCRCWWK